MAEVIQIREIQRARRRAREHQDLERAVAILRDNLASAANQLREAPAPERLEFLDRVEKLAAMVRYGMQMLGEGAAPTLDVSPGDGDEGRS